MFALTEKLLQGESSDPIAQQKSLFRSIDGKAWPTATQNQKCLAVKLLLVIGSPDVVVAGYSKTTAARHCFTFPILKLEIDTWVRAKMTGNQNDRR